MWSESINVYAGMTTGKWNADAGEVDESGARKVSKVRIYSTFYVVGDEPCSEWFKDNRPHADEIKNGSLSYPYENIQDAIDRVIAINNESTSFTICVDGALTCDSAVTQADGESENANINGMADFSALDKTLSLTIKGISKTEKATLNANKATRVIYAVPGTQGNLNLTLENLVITGGDTANTTSKYGAGIYAKGGAYTIRNCAISGNETTDNGGGGYVGMGGSLEIIDCTVSGNTAKSGGGVYVADGGAFTVTIGTISGNTAGGSGGGVYFLNTRGGKFVIGTDCTISGNTAAGSGSGGGVYAEGATSSTDTVLEMTGGKISGNKAYKGGGVYAACGFEMSGGEISENAGEGVCVTSRGVFTMTGGKINDNSVSTYGGGVYNTGTFNMLGTATISGNQQTSTNSYGGAGVCNAGSGTFNMGGNAIISDNKAEYCGGGVYVSGGTFTMSDNATITENASSRGGGVNLYKGTFTMNGGAIIGNKASSYSGVYVLSGANFIMNGGKISNHAGSAVYVDKGAFTMTGGEISNNITSSLGAGVYIGGGTFTMEGGAISDNKSASRAGGVYVLRNGTFSMNGGEISGNTASSMGGGVCIESNCTFSMNGGKISENTAGKGSGAYLSASSVSTLSGAAHFADGNDIYLDSPNIALTISGELTQEKVATITPAAYALDTIILRADGTNITEIDTDICNKFSITPDSDNTVLWNIFPSDDKKSGVLKKGEISSEIQVSVNALEAYTFTTMVNGNAALVEGMALASGNTVKLVKVVDSTGSAQSGQCTLRIQDKSGNPFPSAETTGVPSPSITVPAVPCEQNAQVYVELKFDDGTVINKAVNVTISG